MIILRTPVLSLSWRGRKKKKKNTKGEPTSEIIASRFISSSFIKFFSSPACFFSATGIYENRSEVRLFSIHFARFLTIALRNNTLVATIIAWNKLFFRIRSLFFALLNFSSRGSNSTRLSLWLFCTRKCWSTRRVISPSAWITECDTSELLFSNLRVFTNCKRLITAINFNNSHE